MSLKNQTPTHSLKAPTLEVVAAADPVAEEDLTLTWPVATRVAEEATANLRLTETSPSQLSRLELQACNTVFLKFQRTQLSSPCNSRALLEASSLLLGQTEVAPQEAVQEVITEEEAAFKDHLSSPVHKTTMAKIKAWAASKWAECLMDSETMGSKDPSFIPSQRPTTKQSFASTTSRASAHMRESAASLTARLS
jgi:hypothetical protein